MCQPRLGGEALGFKVFDFVGVAQCQTNVVQAVDQAVFAKGLHIKGNFFALGAHDDLALQINRQLVAGESQGFAEQQIHGGFGQNDGQQAVFETVVEKDVGKTGRNDRAKTVLVNRPRRVFA